MKGSGIGIAPSVRKFLSEIGRRGGQKSRRTLTAEQAREMVRAREVKRAKAILHRMPRVPQLAKEK